MAIVKKKNTAVKKKSAGKTIKKRTAAKTVIKKSGLKKASTKKNKKTSPKKRASIKKTASGTCTKAKVLKRRLADVSADLTGDDLERLTPAEIEEELKLYEEAKPAPSIPKSAVSETDSPGLRLAKRISQLMFEKKAEDVVVADLEGLTSVTDYFVMCTATSDMHARAISDHVQDELEKSGARVHHKEGYASLRWVLLDYVDVIAHVFQKEAREFYDLERLWGDAKFIKMKDDASR